MNIAYNRGYYGIYTYWYMVYVYDSIVSLVYIRYGISYH